MIWDIIVAIYLYDFKDIFVLGRFFNCWHIYLYRYFKYNTETLSFAI